MNLILDLYGKDSHERLELDEDKLKDILNKEGYNIQFLTIDNTIEKELGQEICDLEDEIENFNTGDYCDNCMDLEERIDELESIINKISEIATI